MTGLIYDFASQFFQKEKGFNKDLTATQQVASPKYINGTILKLIARLHE